MCGILKSPCQSIILCIFSSFVGSIFAPSRWIDFKFGVWLHEDGTYIVCNFGCFLLLIFFRIRDVPRTATCATSNSTKMCPSKKF